MTSRELLRSTRVIAAGKKTLLATIDITESTETLKVREAAADAVRIQGSATTMTAGTVVTMMMIAGEAETTATTKKNVIDRAATAGAAMSTLMKTVIDRAAAAGAERSTMSVATAAAVTVVVTTMTTTLRSGADPAAGMNGAIGSPPENETTRIVEDMLTKDRRTDPCSRQRFLSCPLIGDSTDSFNG